MNKNKIDSNPTLNKAVFSCSNVFTVKNALFANKKTAFNTVLLPSFSAMSTFSSYCLPYEWLRKALPMGEAAEQVSHHSRYVFQDVFHQTRSYKTDVHQTRSYKTDVHQTRSYKTDVHQTDFHQTIDKSERHKHNVYATNGLTNNRFENNRFSYNSREDNREHHNSHINQVQKNKLMLFAGNLNQNVVFNKRLWNMNGANNSIIHKMLKLHSKHPNDAKKISQPRLGPAFNKPVEGLKGDAFQGNSFQGDSFRGIEPKNGASLLSKVLDSTDKKTDKKIPVTHRADDVTHNSNNAKNQDELNGHSSTINTVFKQQSVQRTIEALVSNGAQSQREQKAQLQVLQQQIKETEQMNSQDMRRLQQSIFDIKNMLAQPKQGASFVLPKPPSVYGRLK